MFRAAVKNGKAAASALAMFEDRLALRNGKRQIYGSQIGLDPDTFTYFVYPLDDPENVDKRRKEMGLSTLAEYVKYYNIDWDAAAYKKKLPALEKKTAGIWK